MHQEYGVLFHGDLFRDGLNLGCINRGRLEGFLHCALQVFHFLTDGLASFHHVFVYGFNLFDLNIGQSKLFSDFRAFPESVAHLSAFAMVFTMFPAMPAAHASAAAPAAFYSATKNGRTGILTAVSATMLRHGRG